MLNKKHYWWRIIVLSYFFNIMTSSDMCEWMQDFIKRIKDKVEKNSLEWCEIVENIGLTEKERNGWIAVYEEQLDILLEDMNKEALNNQEKLLERIEDLLKQSEALCKELHLKMPEYGSQKLSLLNEQKQLIDKIKEYEEMIEKRRKELLVLENQMKQLCSALGRKPKPVLTSPLPSEEYIIECQMYITSLEKEEFERQEKYAELKTEILKLTKELKYKPALDFEKLVLSEDDNSFKVTDENMECLERFHKNLEEQLHNVKAEIVNLLVKVKSLWEILEEDRQKCTEFLQKHSGYSIEDLEALKLEVRRCEVIKRANIEVFVNKVRQELLYYWDLCCVSQEERKKFIYFDDDLYTEDLLALHDMELERWKKFYAENNVIFKLIEKREHLWKKMLELEEAGENPDRYKNRGGKLLREEKERKIVSKRIPKLEEQLKQMAHEYEVKNGKPFLCHGESLDVIIARTYEERQNEKKLKLSARKQQRDRSVSVTPGKSVMGLTPASSHMNLAASSCKRKLPTSSLSSVKKSRLQPPDKKGLKTAPPKMACRVVEGGRSRYSAEKKRRIEKCRRLSKNISKASANSSIKSVNSSYEQFENGIINKAAGRSTDYAVALSPLAVPLPHTPCRKMEV